MDEYFLEMKKVLEKIETTQRDTIIEAADEIANRLAVVAIAGLAFGIIIRKNTLIPLAGQILCPSSFASTKVSP